MSLPSWINECGLHGMKEHEAKVVKALSIAWEFMERLRGTEHDPEEVMRRIEELSK